ncbi:CotS family spore coat protein [Clostridiaceae bacterium M8S5]|nr:CotS family spore coat protein [Clostridiaceae bacterium M8S5]
MNKIIEKEILEILENYDLIVKSIKTESYKIKKGVWWINTNKGTKILKMHTYNNDLLKFILDASIYLSNNGVNIPTVLLTKNNERFVKIEDRYYVLSQAINGNKFNYTSKDQIKSMVTSLANFHKASIGFKANNNHSYRTHLGRWLSKRTAKANRLKKYYENINQNNPTEFDLIILDTFKHFYKRTISSITEINCDRYNKWTEYVEKNGSLCHQDFAAGNLIKTSKNEIFIIDLDSVTIDIPVRDIRKLLNKIMKKNGQWDINLTHEILCWYNNVNALEHWQWDILKSTLLYPHLYIGIMSKYYEKRETTWPESKYISKLKNIINIEYSLEEIINNFPYPKGG